MHREGIEGPHKGEQRLSGWFYPNGSSDPTSFDKSWIESVARTSAGKWTITAKREYGPYAALIALFVNGHNQGDVGTFRAGARSAQSFGGPGNMTLVVENIDISGNALADVAAHADSIVYVEAVLKYGVAPDGTEL